MELDSQGIERRDFPIVRRGYDPATVDAHLRALAADVEELQREASSRGRESLASTAGTQVQGILEAAQATAETIEREAAQDAQHTRDAANADAKRTREEAVARAQKHVAAVSKATEALLARVGTMDTETQALVESLRTGASQLAGDLATVETNMGALYDAAAGRSGGGEGSAQAGASNNGVAHEQVAATSVAATSVESHVEPYTEPHAESDTGLHTGRQVGEPVLGENPRLPRERSEPTPPVRNDLDGARLVALNMALNGDSREETGRYLAENFDVPDRDRLLDEVYAAIEG
ncbi:MAG TPA: DivIVA domain-containing protein [Solirubrobacteraceae bacterium]|nr:DivIVA domain-containing protein [Solirubrobacteraceae bacterium]